MVWKRIHREISFRHRENQMQFFPVVFLYIPYRHGFPIACSGKLSGTEIHGFISPPKNKINGWLLKSGQSCKYVEEVTCPFPDSFQADQAALQGLYSHARGSGSGYGTWLSSPRCPSQSRCCLRADTPTYHAVSLRPWGEILFGSAASGALRRGREHLPLICNCSATATTPVGCRKIPTQVCRGRFPAMTNRCGVLPKYLLFALCR